MRQLENARWASLKNPGRLADARLEWARNEADRRAQEREDAEAAEIAAEETRRRSVAA